MSLHDKCACMKITKASNAPSKHALAACLKRDQSSEVAARICLLIAAVESMWSCSTLSVELHVWACSQWWNMLLHIALAKHGIRGVVLLVSGAVSCCTLLQFTTGGLSTGESNAVCRATLLHKCPSLPDIWRKRSALLQCYVPPGGSRANARSAILTRTHLYFWSCQCCSVCLLYYCFRLPHHHDLGVWLDSQVCYHGCIGGACDSTCSSCQPAAGQQLFFWYMLLPWCELLSCN
eukprot:GHUV01006929.1.p1 GENE.GHUV01006929.1~~GHUV01006929.1.p1  ORF type:complete len:235 (-),score=23.38 GHUV01006929.1:1107-1811(-)